MKNLKDVYNMKQNLERRMFNMIKKFEDDCNVIATDIVLLQKDKDDTTFIGCSISTELINDKEKLEGIK